MDRHWGKKKQHTFFSEITVRNRIGFTRVATPAENPPLDLPASQEKEKLPSAPQPEHVSQLLNPDLCTSQSFSP